jgi:uncharacterized protein YdhG (YjbR/CyaY superfamily)
MAQVQDEVLAYIESISAEHRGLFDRVHALILRAEPDVQVVLSYSMPTYVLGKRRLHVGAWKHGLSFYGWQHGRDAGLVAANPHLDNGKGTFKLPLADAERITDDQLRSFVLATLSP